MTVDELMLEAMRPAPNERADLARGLLVSLDDLPDSEVEQLWLEEAERRRKAVLAGESELITADEIFARIRARRAS